MRNRSIIGLVLATAALAAGLATPAAAKTDPCIKAIAKELRRAANTNLSHIFSGQTPSAILTASKIDKKCPSLSSSIGYTGCPGIGGCTADTDTSPAGYQKCVNCIMQGAANRIFLGAHSGTCGNGNRDSGEACDPAETSTSCPAGKSCSDNCSCAPVSCGKLVFTFASGTTSCGGPALSPPASAPFSGGLFDATAGGGTKVADLGLGCLYFGGGNAIQVSPGPIPDGFSTTLNAVCDPADPGQITLTGSTGTGPTDCTKGPGGGAAKHCANEPATACTADGDCPTGAKKQCQLDARCFFGPPLSLPNVNVPSLSACVVNVIATDAAGTANASTGEINLTTYLLTSLVYLTGDADFACPTCVSGVCTGAINGGEREGQPCTSVGSKGTTLDCPPLAISYIGALSVNLAPLSTGNTTASATNGIFCSDPFCQTGAGSCDPNDPNACDGVGVCSGQPNAGAFGKGAPLDVPHTARSITETGSPAGNLTDNLPHDATLAYTFCIPPPGEPATSSSDLPGPGAVSLKGTVQLVAAP